VHKSHIASFLPALALIFEGQASAREMVGMAALQVGPIGEGLVFSELDKSQAEVNLGQEVANGRSRSESDTLTATSAYREVAAGVGKALASDFWFGASIRRSTFEATSSASSQSHLGQTVSGSDYELSAGPMLESGGILAGAAVTIVGLGREEKTVAWGAEELRITTEAASIPTVKLTAGIQTGAATIAASVRIANQATVDQTTQSVWQTQTVTTVRRAVGEFSLDGRWQASERLTLGASFSVVAADGGPPQATFKGSPGVSEGAAAFSTDWRDSQRLEWSLGGFYSANAFYRFYGGVSRESASFNSPSMASYAGDNLGGSRLWIGVLTSQVAPAVYFDAGYRLAQKWAFDRESSYADASLLRGNAIVAEEARWTINVGTLIQFL